MGNYIVTRTRSSIVFYTNGKAAFFVSAGITYQLTYIDQGKNGYRFATLRKVIKKIEEGKIQCADDLAGALADQMTWKYSPRRPWEESLIPA